MASTGRLRAFSIARAFDPGMYSTLRRGRMTMCTNASLWTVILRCERSEPRRTTAGDSRQLTRRRPSRAAFGGHLRVTAQVSHWRQLAK